MMVLKVIWLFLFGFLSLGLTAQKAENKSFNSVMADYSALVKAGKFKEGLSCLNALYNSKNQLSPKERLVLNNNLGIANKNLGQYDIALGYYNAAESIFYKDSIPDHSSLVGIYGNIANIYSIKGDFKKALDYCEKAIRSVSDGSGGELQNQKSKSAINLIAGNIYYLLNNYTQALSAFKTSLFLKEKYNLPGKDLLYKQLANTYARIGDNTTAEKYFNLSIKQSMAENKNYGIDLVNIYLEYGHFLLSVQENAKALIPIEKALNISVANIGEKNQVTSNCFQLMGDYYRIMQDYSKALIFYQKTLISGSKDFNDPNIEANPSMTEIIVNLWLLRVLQGKADALAVLAGKERDINKKINDLNLSLVTINLAMEMTNKIRFDYQDEETRLIFNVKQKNVFVGSVETALKLYDLTGEKRFLYQAYQNAQKSKANELKYEIARNKSFSNKEIPDSLRNKEKEIQSSIKAFSSFIRTELALTTPDTVKLAYWKDQQFILNRALEKNSEAIEHNFPRFTDKLKKGNIVAIETVQSNLKPDNSLIEYAFSEENEYGERKLFEFVITPTNLVCHTELIDSTLSADLSGLKQQLADQVSESYGVDNYNLMNQRLFKAYSVLIHPIEKYFAGNQLVIIPDDELSYLPFDAFLTSWTRKAMINYAELPYLIRDYSISYAYTTNTLWNNQQKAEYWPKVIGFAPDYSNNMQAGGIGYNSIKNKKEIASILSNFDGTVIRAEEATISNFSAMANRGAVLHLAMHAELDTTLEGSSSLIFTPSINSHGNFRLYNYEVAQMNIHSPMVVLSACNTGNGKLYSGEGLMSLSRSFILAGVPSVVETLWPVEDIAGSKIMGNFYKYLSEGKPKNTAMRLAKIDYINQTSPSFVNPKFWAAYTLMGDVSAIKKFWWKEPWFLLAMAISISVLAALTLFYWLRFLRIN